MEKEPRSIFRKEALERYVNQEETTTMPGLVSPRLFVFFWVLLGLLVALGAWLSFAEVKTYAFGQGIIMGVDEAGSEGQGQKLRVVSFFPADMHANLAVGKGLMIRSGNKEKWHHLTIISVEPKILSPAEVREKFGLALNHSVAVSISLRDDKEDYDLTLKIFGENSVDVRIPSGSRKIASFLPVLGGFFKKH